MRTDSELLGHALDALSGFFAGDATLVETLDKVAALACGAVPAAAMVGLTMMVGGRASTAAFTDPGALEIDTAQYETGIGPCLDAFRQLQVCRRHETAHPSEPLAGST